jgi:hypothetical protein
MQGRFDSLALHFVGLDCDDIELILPLSVEADMFVNVRRFQFFKASMGITPKQWALRELK